VIIASLTSSVTHAIADSGAYAIFALMALDSLLPVGGELVMLYAGALGAGAIAGKHPTLFGAHLSTGLESFLILSLAGGLGYLFGSLVGWMIGTVGGRTLIERHGRWFHISPTAFARAEHWFDRFGPRAVFFGRLTPVVRSFISIPAGVLGSPLPMYTVLSFLGGLIWCLVFAGAGWALGSTWRDVHDNFRYADYAAVAGVIIVAAVVIWHRVRARGRRRDISGA
jgi:membrane protein DedA with SNARE-associated domain